MLFILLTSVAWAGFGSMVTRWSLPNAGGAPPAGLCLNSTGSRLCIADCLNHRVQYFNRNQPTIAPASLGRVKAIFY